MLTAITFLYTQHVGERTRCTTPPPLTHSLFLSHSRDITVTNTFRIRNQQKKKNKESKKKTHLCIEHSNKHKQETIKKRIENVCRRISQQKIYIYDEEEERLFAVIDFVSFK